MAAESRNSRLNRKERGGISHNAEKVQTARGGDAVEQMESCLQARAALRGRLRAYQAALTRAEEAQERQRLRGKIGVCRAALRDVQVQLDHLDPPAQRRARRERRRQLDVGAIAFDFFERCGTRWSDLEGRTWQQVQEEGGAPAQPLEQWLAEGAGQLTARQREYLDAYYNRGQSLALIARERGVGTSSVSQVIRNGLERLRDWVDSRRLVQSCRSTAGFDWARYLSQVPALTHRQRQLALLVLSGRPRSQRELADKLELRQATVCRTLQTAGRTLRRLQAGGGPAVSRPVIRDWAGADKLTLALETGMPLSFYYRYCFRGQEIRGMSRYLYEIARRRDAGAGPGQVARELGLKKKTAASAFGKLRRLGLETGGACWPESDRLGQQLDAQTYVRLQRMVTARAGT